MESNIVRFANRYLGNPNFFNKPKTDKVICVPYRWATTSSPFRPVYEKLKKNSDYGFVHSVPFPRDIFRGIPEADVIVSMHYHNHILEALKDRKNTIYYPHGLGSETYHKHDMSVFDIVLLNGELPNVPEEVDYKTIGWTKTDILFSKELKERKESLERKLKLDELPYNKTLLWCDNIKDLTYKFLAERIYSWCKKNKVNLLVKGKNRRCGRSYERMKEPWIRFVPSLLEYNVYVVAQFADVLVSGEGSSVIREVYAIELPSFNMMVPGNERLYINQPEVYHIVPERLEDSFRLAFEDKTRFIQPKEVVDKFFYNLDGKATDRFIDVIEGLLNG